MPRLRQSKPRPAPDSPERICAEIEASGGFLKWSNGRIDLYCPDTSLMDLFCDRIRAMRDAVEVHLIKRQASRQTLHDIRGLPDHWRSGLDYLDHSGLPSGFVGYTWPYHCELLEASGNILRAWGRAFADFGWTLGDLFDVSTTDPLRNVEAQALVPYAIGRKVVMVSESGALVQTLAARPVWHLRLSLRHKFARYRGIYAPRCLVWRLGMQDDF